VRTNNAPAPENVIESWEVVTVTGSRYYLFLDDGLDWWMAADNQPNPGSRDISGGTWRIEPPAPWPPQEGLSLRLLAPTDMDIHDPARCPGGGKVTSMVREVRRVF
jgi:hypothetical protein